MNDEWFLWNLKEKIVCTLNLAYRYLGCQCTCDSVLPFAIAFSSKSIVPWAVNGPGWNGPKHNLEETFDVLNNLYNLQDLENGAVDILTDSTKHFKQMIKW